MRRVLCSGATKIRWQCRFQCNFKFQIHIILINRKWCISLISMHPLFWGSVEQRWVSNASIIRKISRKLIKARPKRLWKKNILGLFMLFVSVLFFFEGFLSTWCSSHVFCVPGVQLANHQGFPPAHPRRGGREGRPWLAPTWPSYMSFHPSPGNEVCLKPIYPSSYRYSSLIVRAQYCICFFSGYSSHPIRNIFLETLTGISNG